MDATENGAANDPVDTASQACSECRRRKLKCTRTFPRCSQCRRFTRNCIYEKQNKPRLTRQYVTEVETELARARAILQEVLPQAEYENLVASSSQTGNQNGLSTAQRLNSEAHQESPLVQTRHFSDISTLVPPASADPQQYITSAPIAIQNVSNAYDIASNSLGRDRTPSAVTPGSSVHATRLSKSSEFPLESPPASGNFEWDERTGKPEGDRFTDGMASLSELNEGGYLGVASGAALLRLTGPTSVSADSNDTRNTDMAVPRSISPPSQLDGYFDSYFSLYHVSYPIVHEPTFRAQYMEVIPRPTHPAWQVLMYIVAAIGAYTAAGTTTEVDLALFRAAKSNLSIDLLETGNIVVVQALTLISNYLQKRNKPNSGYNYMGLARRIAMGIGLHKEFPNWETSRLNLEIRRRVWWCLYVFDVGAIITFSRPMDFPERGVEVQLPLNVHDADLTAATKSLPAERQETTIYTHVAAQSRFHMATMQLYSQIISTPYPRADELIQLDDAFIGNWLTSLPSYFQEHAAQAPKFALCHAILRWRYRNFRILMYRPFVIRQVVLRGKEANNESVEQDDASSAAIAVQRCLNGARETVDLISEFWNTQRKSMMACWYGLYFLFQAIMIPAVCLRNDPQSDSAWEWRDQIIKAIQVIEDMALLNQAATRCLGVINSLCGIYLGAESIGWEATQESPQTQLNNLYPLLWPTLESMQFDGNDTTMQDYTIMEFMNQIPGFD